MTDAPDRLITYDRLHDLTAPFARYQQFPGSEDAILRSGLVEETLEYIFGFKNVAKAGLEDWYGLAVSRFEAQDRESAMGENGDIWWYISEVSRFHNLSAADVLSGAPNLAVFQAEEKTNILPIYGSDGEQLTMNNDCLAALAVTALRAVDVINPRTGGLWRGFSARPTLGRAVGDLAKATSFAASRQGFSVTAAVNHTAEKLEQRVRPAAVIGEAGEARDRTSVRERLEVVPWVRSLIFESGGMQWDAALPGAIGNGKN